MNTIFQTLLTLRTPGIANAIPIVNQADRPFLGMAAGVSGLDSQYLPAYGFPSGNDINHTLFTSGVAGTLPITPGALGQGPQLQLPTTAGNPQTTHPYLQNELLTKIYKRLTTRSNVYAVFLTVGFFQVMPGVTAVGQPNVPQLGPEIGRSEGRQVRHRMFAILDRTNLSVTTTTSNTVIAAPVQGAATTATVGVAATTGVNPNTGAAWTVQAGTQLVIEPGTANEETVTVTAATGTSFTANFLLPHPNPLVTGNTTGSYAITLRGNPGPWTLIPYDPRKDPGVVLYYNIIN